MNVPGLVLFANCPGFRQALYQFAPGSIEVSVSAAFKERVNATKTHM